MFWEPHFHQPFRIQVAHRVIKPCTLETRLSPLQRCSGRARGLGRQVVRWWCAMALPKFHLSREENTSRHACLLLDFRLCSLELHISYIINYPGVNLQFDVDWSLPTICRSIFQTGVTVSSCVSTKLSSFSIRFHCRRFFPDGDSPNWCCPLLLMLIEACTCILHICIELND